MSGQYVGLLDSTRLLNLKQRYGIAIRDNSSVNCYIIAKKVEKVLFLELKTLFTYDVDTKIFISNIIDKLHDAISLECLLDHLELVGPKQFKLEASKIKQFISLIKINAEKKVATSSSLSDIGDEEVELKEDDLLMDTSLH